MEAAGSSAWVQRVTRVLVAPVLGLPFRGGAVGGEHVPRVGPALLACNHASFLDPWFFGLLCPRFPLRYLMTTSWYRRSALWRAFFRGNGAIPTDPADPAQTLDRVVAALELGDAVLVFPEGGISRDGRINRGRHGIGWMAALSGAPVVPCALRGNHDAFPLGRRLPRARRVWLHAGPPLRFAGAPVPRPEPDAVHAFTSALMDAICRLAGQDERAESARPVRRDAALRFALEGGHVVGLR